MLPDLYALLDRFHAVGLFSALSRDELAQLVDDLGQDAALGAPQAGYLPPVLEWYLGSTLCTDYVVNAPVGIGAWLRLVTGDVDAPARPPLLPEIFGGSAARIALHDPQHPPPHVPPPAGRWVALRVEGQTTFYTWHSFLDLMGLYNQALLLAEDPRRFYAIQSRNENVPSLFVLLNQDQCTLFASLQLFHPFEFTPPPPLPHSAAIHPHTEGARPLPLPADTPPPRVPTRSVQPFFVGHTITAGEESIGSSPPRLAVQPQPGHAWTEPLGTCVLYLPLEHMVSVHVQSLPQPGRSALCFVGHFSRVDRHPQVIVAPVATEDAQALVRTLHARYRLPRIPLEVPPSALSTLPRDAFVSFVDMDEGGHIESPNLGPLVLPPQNGTVSGQIRRGVYRAVGFYQPVELPADDIAPPIGYSGPRLLTVALQDPDYIYPCVTASGIRVQAYVGVARRTTTSIHPLSHDRTLAVMAQGMGGQDTGDFAIEAVQHVLRLLMTPSPPPPLVAPTFRGTSSDALLLDIEYTLDRAPLPTDPGELLLALANRIGAVLGHLNARHYAVFADGVLACIQGSTLTVLRRGLARLYRIRGGILSLLVPEHTLAVEYARHSTLTLDPVHRFIPLSSFVPSRGEDPTPVEFALQSGDRLMVLGGRILEVCADALLETLLLEPDLGALVLRLTDACPAIPRNRWSLSILDIPPAP